MLSLIAFDMFVYFEYSLVAHRFNLYDKKTLKLNQTKIYNELIEYKGKLLLSSVEVVDVIVPNLKCGR